MKLRNFPAAQCTLARLLCGDRGVVTSISENDSELRARLMMLGIVPGTDVEVVAVAPLGCPLTIRVRGFQLALRRSEASAVSLAI